MNVICLRGLRGETLLGYLATLGAFRLLSRSIPNAKLSWSDSGSGWIANVHLPCDTLSDADQVTEVVFKALDEQRANHPVLQWARFLKKDYFDESAFFREATLAFLDEKTTFGSEYAPVFSSQVPLQQAEGPEHFDHPFRAARKDYYLGNLESVLTNTMLSHVRRTILFSWDYGDAMSNQSLRLDQGDDRRHAYQWHAPTDDPDRKKTGCMLGANRLALEAFPFFPCIPCLEGSTAVGFVCKSKTYTWFHWPIWKTPCSVQVIGSLLNLRIILDAESSLDSLRKRGIEMVFQGRRLPVEKNKVFLPPVAVSS